MVDRCGFDGKFEAVYQPVLVMRSDKPYVRDSADVVVIFNPNSEGDQSCVPVEVKTRVSLDTFHRTVAHFNKRRDLADLPGVGCDGEDDSRVITIRSYSRHLLGMIPESYDLFQVLHHAYTYNSLNCWYLISSHISLFYMVSIRLIEELMNAYGDMLDW